MKHRIRDIPHEVLHHEQTHLFASVLKWFFLASVVGILGGLATSLFLNILNWSLNSAAHMAWRIALLPFGLILSTFLVRTLAPDAEGHGTEKVIEAVHQRFGKMNPRVIPVKLVATIVTLVSGGSAGKEGPCAQIGAGLASLFSDIFRLSDLERRKLVICGVSAGFTTVFGAPISGALFAVEVLAVGRIQYDVLFPAFVAGVTGYQVAKLLGADYFSIPLKFHNAFSEVQFLEVAAAGVLIGLSAFLFINLLHWVENCVRKQNWHPYFTPLLGGGLLVVMMLFSTRYLGLGLGQIEGLLTGDVTSTWYDPFLKMISTAVTLSFGGSGGILTPIFFIGSSVGSIIGQLFHMNASLFAALGLIGFLSGCANTPIAASVMAMELFGTEIGVYAAMVSIISFLMTGHRSVYPSQILSMKKSESWDILLGQPMHSHPPLPPTDKKGEIA